MKREQHKKTRGITLIALVVTIVVLLILAAISINFVLGPNGIIAKAQEAAKKTEQASIEESDALNKMMNQYENAISGTIPDDNEPDPYVDGSIVIPPQVSSEGMTPVKWDETQSKWVKTDVTDNEWYDYGEKRWANIVLVDENGKDADGDQDVFNSDGTLNEDSNYSMLVWIPRYAYQITSQYNQAGTGAGNINIAFIDTNNKGKDGVTTYTTEYPNATTNGGMDDYVVHPAFDFGDVKLPGFWVGKFETSNTAGTTGSDTTLIAQIKAGVPSWRNININGIHTVCTELNRENNPYGLLGDTEVDPHMMKNSEWGAVAYLSTNATYGKGTQLEMNDSSSFITGDGNYKENVAQSTTGNVTGIYDMSGGSWEYTAAYLGSGSIYGSDLMSADPKYSDVYTSYADPKTNGNYGDAVYETSGWNGDYAIFPDASEPFFERGGDYVDGEFTGLFYYLGDDGDAIGNNTYGTFRIVIPVL